MDTGIDSRTSRMASSRRPPGESPSAVHVGLRMDWPGLTARFEAAQALRHSLNAPASLLASGDGAVSSFDAAAARALAAYPAQNRAVAAFSGQSIEETFPAVNPVVLADRKTSTGIESDVAGPNAPGTRGLK